MIARPSTRKSSSGSGTPSARAARCTSGTSGRLASNAAIVSRAAVACPAAACASASRSRRCGSFGSRATRRDISASAASCRPDAESSVARSPTRSSRSGSRRSASRSAAIGARKIAPRPHPLDARLDVPAARLQRRLQPGFLLQRAPVLRAPPQRLDHRTRRVRQPTRIDGREARAGRRLDGAVGVELQPARRERAREQQLRREPSGRGARGGPARLYRVARPFVLQRERREIVPGPGQRRIDGDRRAQRRARRIAGDAGRTRRIVVRDGGGQRQPERETRPRPQPRHRDQRIVGGLGPLRDRGGGSNPPAVPAPASLRRRSTQEDEEREARDAAPRGEPQLDVVPARGEREPRRRESRAVPGRRPVAERCPAVDRQAPLTRVVDDDVVPAARAVERHADHPARRPGRRPSTGDPGDSPTRSPAASCAARAPTAAPAHPGPRSRAVRSRRRRRPSSRNPRRARSARAHRRPRPRAPRGWPGATARRAPARAAPRCAPAPRARAAR